jgi:hypothetical protein
MPKSAIIAKTIGYIACLSAFGGVFLKGEQWNLVILAVIAFSFFYLGAFWSFAADTSIIDFWGQQSRIGIAFSDPTKGKQAMLFSRVLGILFIIFALYFAFSVFRHPISINTTRR